MTTIIKGRYPGALWKPINVNYSKGGNRPRLFIVHVMQGTLAGTDAWFHDPISTVSAHFGVGRNGTVIQWVNTEDIAWHAVAANSRSIGVEHEGWSGEPLTHLQLEATARQPGPWPCWSRSPPGSRATSRRTHRGRRPSSRRPRRQPP